MKKFLKYVLLPIAVFAIVLMVFKNAGSLSSGVFQDRPLALRYSTKFIATILLPLLVIKSIYRNHYQEFGFNFDNYKYSLIMALRSYGVAGPAGITFWLIALLGYSFQDWSGAFILSGAYLIVLVLIPRVTSNHLNTSEATIDNSSRKVIIPILLAMSLLTCILAYTSQDRPGVLIKALYYLFIVGFGEELFFRGYIQSSLNQFFGKPFSLWGTNVGWGFVITSVLFGLIHALASNPPTWPWALFTAIMGFGLGFVRERSGSILAPILLHGLMDLPLAFFGK